MRDELLSIYNDLIALQARLDALKGNLFPNVPSLEQAKVWIIGQLESGKV